MLKCRPRLVVHHVLSVSVLFNESKLLKSRTSGQVVFHQTCFSTLQRVEIAEIGGTRRAACAARCGFSTLQRVEIAEIVDARSGMIPPAEVSVLFNESKLLKSEGGSIIPVRVNRFSTLQRVEIAEIGFEFLCILFAVTFQYSSTSRNC